MGDVLTAIEADPARYGITGPMTDADFGGHMFIDEVLEVRVFAPPVSKEQKKRWSFSPHRSTTLRPHSPPDLRRLQCR